MFFIIGSFIIKFLYDIQIILLLPDKYSLNISYLLDFSISKYLFGWFFFICFVFFYIKIRLFLKKSSDLIGILFLFCFIPTVSSFGINNSSFSYFFIQCIYWLLVFIFGVLLNNPNYSSMPIRFSSKLIINLYYLYIIILFIIVVIFIKKYNNFSFNLALSDIYDVREESRRIPVWFSWIKNSMGNIGVPLLLVSTLYHKKYFYSFLVFCIGVLLFLIGMDKSYIMYMVIALSCSLYFGINQKIKIIDFFILIVIFLFLLSLFEYFLNGTSFVFYLFVRRSFYIPSWVNLVYFDFFSTNKVLLFSQDVFMLSNFSSPRYSLSVLELINSYFFHGTMPSPNTGLFAESFMHFGYFGVLFFPLTLVILITVSCSYVNQLKKPIRMTYYICFSFLLLNLPITGSLFISIMVFSFPVLFFETKIYKG